jgi:hypothetical protein
MTVHEVLRRGWREIEELYLVGGLLLSGVTKTVLEVEQSAKCVCEKRVGEDKESGSENEVGG